MPQTPLQPKTPPQAKDKGHDKPIDHDTIIQAMENASPEIQEYFNSITLGVMSLTHQLPNDPYVDKLDSEHLMKILDNEEAENKRRHSREQTDRIIWLVVFLSAVTFTGIILFNFKDSEHFVTILSSVFSFLGGLGVGKFTNKRKDSE